MNEFDTIPRPDSRHRPAPHNPSRKLDLQECHYSATPKQAVNDYSHRNTMNAIYMGLHFPTSGLSWERLHTRSRVTPHAAVITSYSTAFHALQTRMIRRPATGASSCPSRIPVTTLQHADVRSLGCLALTTVWWHASAPSRGLRALWSGGRDCEAPHCSCSNKPVNDSI